MKKFTYKIFSHEFEDYVTNGALYEYFEKNNIPHSDNADDSASPKEIFINYKINSLGKKGWELVSVIEKEDKIICYFKQEI